MRSLLSPALRSFSLPVLLAGALATAAPAPTPPSPDPRFVVGELIAHDDFGSAQLPAWHAELERGGSVTARDGVLDVDVPGGCTLWLKQRLSGPLLIEYQATAVAKGGPNDRVSDLNCFWMATDARHPGDLFATQRTGKFSDYDQLRCYYVGFGGNTNTTTRFRRYIGESGNRPLRAGDDLSDPAFLLVPNKPQRLQLVAAGTTIAYYCDGRRLFSFEDPRPYEAGWFALRTVTSHLQVREFRVWRLDPVNVKATRQK